ncbi:pitrilysin family protein [Pannus brasiliensis CCIBt3594]|uniref:Pitrilysin family protein n=1 Tax=Pannus brasiliensis CCIBt3594 TaxID=1427578 RepID=A0AAW9QL45_9CHRO
MLTASPVHRLTLDNGITLLFVENPAADVIAGRIFLKNAGTRYENREKAGLFHLLATLLTKGTENRSSVEIAEMVESTGASLGADTGTDYFVVSLKTVSSDFLEIFRLAEEILRCPSFPETEIELEKNLTCQSIRSQQEQPFNVAFHQLRTIMYPDHPYGLSILGTEESVARIDREDLLNCHRTFFRPDNLVISLSGRCTLEQAVRAVEEVFGSWSVPDSVLPPLALPTVRVDPRRATTARDTQQSIVMLGYLGASVLEEDYAVLKLLGTYLGNGLSSRLFVELREKRGLAYDVSALYPTRLYPSQFVIYLGTAPVNTSIALDGLRAEAERLCHATLSEDELQSAKNKLLGQYALGKQTNAEIAQLYGWYEALGLGIDFDLVFQEAIARVSAEQARQAAAKYLEQPYLSLVGPAEAIEL